MKTQIKTRIFYLFIIAFICIVYALACRATLGQSDTCANGDQLVLNTSTKRYQCITPGAQPAGTGTTMLIANAGVTGTTVNRFAKLTGAPSTAVVTATSDVDGAVGIVVSGAGTTGNATIAILGQATCAFDGSTTAGNYVVISAITAGMCHDGGSAFPTAQAAYGRVLTTNVGAGSYIMELMTPDIAFQNAGNGKSKPGGSNQQVQYNNSGVFGGSSEFLFVDAVIDQVRIPSGNAASPGLGLNGLSTGIYQAAGPVVGVTIGSAAKFIINDDLNIASGGGYKFSSSSSPAGAGGTNDTGLCRNAAGTVGASNGDNFCTLRDFIGRKYLSGTNCADSAGAAACGSAAAGSVVIDAGATTVVVSTTAVTANSQIFVQYDSSLGARLSVTCNVTPALPAVTARTAATSFTITVPVAPITDPACYSYFIVN